MQKQPQDMTGHPRWHNMCAFLRDHHAMNGEILQYQDLITRAYPLKRLLLRQKLECENYTFEGSGVQDRRGYMWNIPPLSCSLWKFTTLLIQTLRNATKQRRKRSLNSDGSIKKPTQTSFPDWCSSCATWTFIIAGCDVGIHQTYTQSCGKKLVIEHTHTYTYIQYVVCMSHTPSP